MLILKIAAGFVLGVVVLIVGCAVIAGIALNSASDSIRDSVLSPEAQATAVAAAATVTTANAGAQPAAGSTQKLALISAKCTKDTIGFVTCEGFVKNLTAQSLQSLQVVVQWYDASNVAQSADTGFVQYSPLLPGQESPWQTIGRANPALTGYRIQFKEIFGGTISYRDDRPQ